MIVRIVKLSFEKDKVDDFLENFHNTKSKIRNFEGCNRLELLRVKNKPNVFMTYSYWNDESDLEKYRLSELFQGVWTTTKKWFNDKPEAWTVVREEILE